MSIESLCRQVREMEATEMRLIQENQRLENDAKQLRQDWAHARACLIALREGLRSNATAADLQDLVEKGLQV